MGDNTTFGELTGLEERYEHRQTDIPNSQQLQSKGEKKPICM